MKIKKRAIAITKQMRFDCDFPPLSYEGCNVSVRGDSFLRVIDISKKIITMRGFEDVVSDD